MCDITTSGTPAKFCVCVCVSFFFLEFLVAVVLVCVTYFMVTTLLIHHRGSENFRKLSAGLCLCARNHSVAH